MKRLIIGFLCTVMSSTPTPSISSNNIFIPSGKVSWSETVISGDANKDSSINIADAVLLQKYLTSGKYENDDLSCLDINFDGTIDSFDMTLMRQSIISPETPLSRTYSVDILKSAGELPINDSVLTDFNEMYDYLSSFISDDSELQLYLDRYDESFFEENNLVLVTFMQEYGRGIYYEISSFGKMRPNLKARMAGDEIFLTLTSGYDAYKVLYPVTNTPLLVQATIPKAHSKAGDFVSVFDTNGNETDMSSHIYLSPDGTKEITITQETIGNISDIRVFLRQSKISFKALTYMTGYGEKPFTDEGEWSVDSDGNSVFGNGETYSITWLDNAISIDHQIKEDHWEKVYVDFEGEDVQCIDYTKE
ncbi:MAG: dockerin type I repeat-containing protein [Ruminococcus flavefaciens]|nr:dockerin type I repeat-containing protein [Ruminococcus flavefaciens]